MRAPSGDYTSFRSSLLRARAGESALSGWHPAPGTDLALQMLEWWAYLADVLAFYNERAGDESYLRTAVLPENVRRIIRLLGYRPRPGIAATGVVAALVDSPRPFVVGRGFSIEGAAARGQPAQIFEVDDEVEIGVLGRPLPRSARFPAPAGGRQGAWRGPGPTDAAGRLLNLLPAAGAASSSLQVQQGQPLKLALAGVITTVQEGDTILALKRGWDGSAGSFAMLGVQAVTPVWDEAGNAATSIETLSAHSLPADASRDDYKLLKATKTAHLWLYHERYPGSSNPMLVGSGLGAQIVENIVDPLHLFTGGVSGQPAQDPSVLTGSALQDPGSGAAHLEAITRGISAGDPVLFEKRIQGGLGGLFQAIQHGLPPAELPELLDVRVQLVKVTGYAEDIWYANAPEMDRIGQGPPVGPPAHSVLGSSPAPIPIPHTRLNFAVNPVLDLMAEGDRGLRSILVHYDWREVGQMVDPPVKEQTTAVNVPAPDSIPQVPVPVLIQDVTKGRGSPGWLRETASVPDGLLPPLRALLHLLPVSRGQTVANEVLGSGDPLVANQEFVLKRSPLTYLADNGPGSWNGYRSTLRVRVDGIEWHEAPSFYGQPADARVFAAREDEEQQTHVRFGDGENGRRLPAGTDNVVAWYRVGSGAAVPLPGTLTSILTPQPGIQAIENPVPPGGGADPDPPEQIRAYAPRSVLTFGRAVSGDDFETVAAQTPGVRRARVCWSWDPASQRTAVKVYVGDDAAAVQAASATLRAFADPNRPVLVALAAPVHPDLSLTLVVDPDSDPDEVQAAVSAALLDPASEPFGVDVVRIGQVVYDSDIYGACLRVPGVVAVRALRFAVAVISRPALALPGPTLPLAIPVLRPRGTLPVGRLPFPVRYIVQRGERHAPGEGNFYLLSADHLQLATEVARHGP